MASVYEQICAEYNARKALPYAFMPSDAGRAALSSLWAERMPVELRCTCAKESCDAVFFEGKISEADPVWYAAEFQERVEALVEIGCIGWERVREAGLRLAKEGETPNEAGLGLLLLGFSQDDIASKIIERLALHSRFTLIAIAACARWPGRNDRLFEWLRKTGGYGRMACLLAMIPLTHEQKKWIFLRAWEDAQPRRLLAVHLLDRPDLAEYIRSLPVDSENFHAFSRLIGYASLAERIQSFSEFRWLVLRYAEGIAHADRFVDLFALQKVCLMLSDQKDEECRASLERCWKAKKKLVARGAVEAELACAAEDSEMLASVMRVEDIEPPLDALAPVIAKQELPLAMLEFLLSSHARDYPAELLEWIRETWPEKVFCEAPTAEDWEQLQLGHFDIWLAEALEAMKGRKELDEPFLLRCARARAKEVRVGALKCLRAVRKAWTASVEPALRDWLVREPDADVSKRIRRMLGMSGGGKQQRYVDVSELDVGAIKGAKDFDAVMDTVIAGAWFRDLSPAEDLVEAGDVLLLVREPDNPYDAKAIMVLAEDGYMLGYIPRADNPALAERMDRGEFFCAILNERLHAQRPSISVIRPHSQDVRRKLARNVVPFPKYPGLGG